MRDVALQLLEFLFRENLHEVVDVQQDAIEVDAVDGRREEADHPPQTLDTEDGCDTWRRLNGRTSVAGIKLFKDARNLTALTFMTSSEDMGGPAVVTRPS